MMKSFGPISKIALFFGFYGMLLLQSCVSHKEITSLNGKENVPKDLRTEKEISTSVLYKFKPYEIQPYDQLMIRLNAFDGSTEDFLNREFSVNSDGGNNIDFSPETVYFSSFSVDEKGNIDLPFLGSKKVSGMTVKQLKKELDKDYEPHLRFASALVKLGNKRFTVIGEVNDPGVYYMYNEQVTLLDAIGMAGDFTDFANRQKVKVIRQTNGHARAVYLNLNRSDFLTTEFYYTRPSDVIYIEPIKKKSLEVSSQTVGVVISAISLGTLVLTLLFK